MPPMYFAASFAHNGGMNTTTQLPDDLITPIEVAAIAKVSSATVRRWIIEGKLAAWRAGKHWLVSRADAVAFVVPFVPPGLVATPGERRRREREVDENLRAAKIRR